MAVAVAAAALRSDCLSVPGPAECAVLRATVYPTTPGYV